MSVFARRAVLAGVSLLGLGLGPDASAQVARTKDAPAAPKGPVDVFNRIEGESTVVKLKSAGTVVKKGEWVLQFDATDLQDALTNQMIGVKAAEAAYRNAKMNREVAEIGVKEFVDGISKEDIEQADAAIAQATADRLHAEDQANTSKSEDSQHALGEAQINERKAKAKKAILVKYTEVKDRKELESEVFKAKEEELMKEAALMREKLKAEKLRREIEECKVVAPIAGTVGYLRPVSEEDTFKQGEVLFRIFPEAKVKPESAPK